jgi:hypothetical protein
MALAVTWAVFLGRVVFLHMPLSPEWPPKGADAWALVALASVAGPLIALHGRSMPVRSSWLGYMTSGVFLLSTVWRSTVGEAPGSITATWGASIGLILAAPIHAAANADWHKPTKRSATLVAIGVIALLLPCAVLRNRPDALLIAVTIVGVACIVILDRHAALAVLAASYATGFIGSVLGAEQEIGAQRDLGVGQLEAVRAGVHALRLGLGVRIVPLLVVQVFALVRHGITKREAVALGSGLLLAAGWAALIVRAGIP